MGRWGTRRIVSRGRYLGQGGTLLYSSTIFVNRFKFEHRKVGCALVASYVGTAVVMWVGSRRPCRRDESGRKFHRLGVEITVRDLGPGATACSGGTSESRNMAYEGRKLLNTGGKQILAVAVKTCGGELPTLRIGIIWHSRASNILGNSSLSVRE